jgi:hypothetical protein
METTSSRERLPDDPQHKEMRREVTVGRGDGFFRSLHLFELDRSWINGWIAVGLTTYASIRIKVG